MINEFVYGSMTGYTDLYNTVDGRIYYHLLPRFHDFDKIAIVYETNTIDNINTGSHQNITEVYLVKIKVVGRIMSEMNTINRMILDYFNANDIDEPNSAKYNCDIIYQTSTVLFENLVQTHTIINTFRASWYNDGIDV